jgi:uncharacterized lipoprotein YddW (UPF0748 family)
MRLRRTRHALLLAGVLLLAGGPHARATDHDEVRALWVVRTTLSSPDAVARLVETAREGRFNTLLVQVRGRGDAYYAAGREPRAAVLAGQPAFDPLAEAIARGREAGLRVHAWINVNLVASLSDLPASPVHVVNRRPEWLMVPRAIAADLARIEPRSPEYLDRLTRQLRGRTDVEGLYVSPLSAEAADYTVAVVRDVATRYAVDGIHLDYVRYPSDDFDFSREGVAAFRRSVLPDLTPEDRRRYDSRMAAEPLIYTDAFPQRWRTFRQQQLTELVVKIREAVKTARPAVTLSAAVFPDAGDALDRRLQNWPGWLASGLLDVVCPMAYTTDPRAFAAQIAAARAAAGARGIWAGIGAYRLTPAEILANVETARRLGAGGVVLFSYDSLVEPPRGPAHLIDIGRSAFQP